jgi:hypothetical protein
MSQGLLPDELTAIVQKSIRSGKGLPPEKQQELIDDPEKVVGMIAGIDKMMPIVVVEPKVRYHCWTEEDVSNPLVLGGRVTEDMVGKEIPEGDRDEDEWIYTDEVDFEDKMFIFNYAVGGTRDHSRFRQKLADGVGDLQSLQGGEDQPE